ncbi:MAG: tRNA uridine-5-carboxymethylaminomethyl(34) synthesis GTPase MnmE [Candidatus Omnitrophica bacterium]|nr:tRNA uridine-5-carboxymethylaminomethyl(34) synthesis GTPase MnmE [Candidatus Omnitrophota bacterium]
MFNIDDTIAAIATPLGEGGIGIVRLSGRQALEIADRIFVSRDGGKPSCYETYTTHYGHIVEGAKKEIVDEVILTVMKAPKSYTRQDVVEINCHGGIVPLKRVMELTLAGGARPAEPGEFTKRAFVNGRIDLARAEAVLDVIKAKTDRALASALFQLDGGVSRFVRALKEDLLDVKVHLEAAVDFPDEGLPRRSPREIRADIAGVKLKAEKFLRSFDAGKIVREGINCVICGRTNVGKSSLMNLLLNEERVIVTSVAGTTRDAVSECVNIDGIAVNLTDTAGISRGPALLEKEASRKSRLWIERADLILFMMDLSREFDAEDEDIIELIKSRDLICVLNKADQPRRLDLSGSQLEKLFGRKVPVLEMSVLTKQNLGLLFKTVSSMVFKGEVSANDFNMLTNVRHKDSIFKAASFLEEALTSLDNNEPEDIVALSVNEAIAALGDITGETVSAEVLDRIFSRFCVGK